MKITFMIGNGFDVGLGIESSYSNFYRWYCAISSEKEQINKFKDEIKKELDSDIPDDEKNWADFEIGLGKYTEKFTKDTVDCYIDCYEDAQERIAEYLRIQESRFDPDEYTEKSFEAFQKSISDFYADVPDREKNSIKEILNSNKVENREVSFISFNYTNSIERILEKINPVAFTSWVANGSRYSFKLNPNVLHVHGTTTAFPILGVNDDSQILNKELLDTPQLKEMLIKTECINALGELWQARAEEQISNSQMVCILGMSLGASDAKWWRKIAQWLKASNARHLIIFWYEKNPPNGVSVTKQIRCINKVKDKLLSYTDLQGNELSSVRNRIHVVINTKTFLQLEKKPKKTEEQEPRKELVQVN